MSEPLSDSEDNNGTTITPEGVHFDSFDGNHIDGAADENHNDDLSDSNRTDIASDDNHAESTDSSLFGDRDEQRMRHIMADKIASCDSIFDAGSDVCTADHPDNSTSLDRVSSTLIPALLEATDSALSPTAMPYVPTSAAVQASQHPGLTNSDGDGDADQSDYSSDFSSDSSSSYRNDNGTQTDDELASGDQGLNLDVLTPSNAQRYLLPNGCVFVANLVIRWPDKDIVIALQAAFSKFGPVYIKLKRDQAGFPYAFVQFTSSLDATKAMQHGKNISIGGRTLRIEQARCERTLYCYRNMSPDNFDPISDIEMERMRRHVSAFDQVESIERVSAQDCAFYNLLPGVWITLRYYGTCHDTFVALNSLRFSDWSFKFFRDRSRRNETFANSKKLDYRSRFVPADLFVNSNPDLLDCGSVIHVHGLPPTVMEAQLATLFAQFGSVFKVMLSPDFVKDVQNGYHSRTAYVGFAQLYAGPAACAAADVFGVSIQDACRLTWNSLTVTVIHFGSRREGGAIFNMETFEDYVSQLIHPALARANGRNKPISRVDWNCSADYQRWYNASSIKACSPMLGVQADKLHMQAYNFPINGYCDNAKWLYAPWSSRSGHYAKLQGFDWEPADGHNDSPAAFINCSGMSPTR